MIKCDLLKLTVIRNFYDEICVEFSVIIFDTAKWNCETKTREMFSFLPLINNSVTIELSFLVLSILTTTLSNTINVIRFLFGLYFPIFLYHPYHVTI